jgi:hypothetical protein
MWLFSETGFISAVTHWDDEDTIVVRARDMESLQDIAELAGVEIRITPENDYPARVHVPRSVFGQWVAREIATMSYGNYKSRMAQTRGKRFTNALHNVWSAMLAVEDVPRGDSYGYHDASLEFNYGR